jgi:outer membrane protein TolC
MAAIAQQTIALDVCYEKAIANYPLMKQQALLQNANELTSKNLNKNFLPQMQINGQVSYQSDVTQVPFEGIPQAGIEPFEPLSKDWYKIMLDLNQVIYDGGATGNQKSIEEINHELEQQNLTVEEYKLKEQINQVYFNILLLKENKHILDLHVSTLMSKSKALESGVINGTILASNEDILKAEIILMEQSVMEIQIMISSTIAILNEYTALNLNTQTEFEIPNPQVDFSNFANLRPEYALFGIQQKKIEASKKLVGSKTLPTFSAFGQAGYGRPGYDMLENQFADFYMFGARLSWNFWDWNHGRQEKAILDINSKIIDSQKETFDKNTRIILNNKLAEIRKFEEFINRDAEIILLREKITKSISSQLDNGVITASEYLTELNAESKAKLDLEKHKIELAKAKLNYNATLGNL